MTYVDMVLMAVPDASREAFVARALSTYEILKKHGALSCADAWEDAVPESMSRAVALKEGEFVCVGWLVWPDKLTHDLAWAKMRLEMQGRHDAPFDMQRMMFGGFDVVAQA